MAPINVNKICKICYYNQNRKTLLKDGWCNFHGEIYDCTLGETRMGYPTKNYPGDCADKEPIKQEPLKKYYVGAKHIAAAVFKGGNSGCMRETLEEAKAEAIALVEAEEADCAVVVEIKLVVRKPKKPVDIQEV